MKKKLVVFDFDGTITYKDSMLELVKFYHGSFRYLLGMFILSPMLVLYKLGFIPNWRAKEYFLTYFFRNEMESRFQSICDRFAVERIPVFTRPAATQCLQQHREKGDHLVVVSSSAENWLLAWCQQQEINLIATRLKVRDGHITGQLEGLNCYGQEKVNRLQQEYSLDDFSEVIVYGDSQGDYGLFDIASHHYYKPFNND